MIYSTLLTTFGGDSHLKPLQANMFCKENSWQNLVTDERFSLRSLSSFSLQVLSFTFKFRPVRHQCRWLYEDGLLLKTSLK